ncbi:EamA family transporter [Chloroflexota bacterium]
MDWISIAILSAATFALVNTVDSHLLSKRLPGVRVFMLFLGIVHLIYGLLTLYLFPLPAGIGLNPILVAVVSGIIRTAAIIIMLYLLKREEVSRVVPVVYTYPIFVAVIAVPLLGETLSYLQWLAVVIVVAGAVIVSVRRSPSGTTLDLRKSLVLFLGASLSFALADITGKYALAYISFWNLFSINALCLCVSFFLISVRSHVIRQLISLSREKSTLILLVLNEILAPVAIVLSYWALARGPVSLVSTIVSSRPAFVLIFAFILNRILPSFLKWQAGKEMLVLRIVATGMIVGGIAIIYLT